MTDFIKEFIVDVFGAYAWLGILIIAMIPIIELRGAIPFALGSAWGVHKLTIGEAYLSSVLGATIPALVIIPLLIPVFNYLKKTKFFKKIVEKLDEKFSSKSKKIEEDIKNEANAKKAEFKKFIGVMTFVAVPLPLTGAWTGSAVAAYLKMPYWKGVLAILLGNMVSGGIMTLLCVCFPNAVDLILNIFLILVLVVIVVSIIIMLVKNKKKDSNAILSSENEVMFIDNKDDTIVNKEQESEAKESDLVMHEEELARLEEETSKEEEAKENQGIEEQDLDKNE